MEEAERRDALSAYQGDMLHGVFRVLCGFSGHKADDILSYSDVYERLYAMTPQPSRQSNAETLAAVEDMLSLFLP